MWLCNCMNLPWCWLRLARCLQRSTLQPNGLGPIIPPCQRGQFGLNNPPQPAGNIYWPRPSRDQAGRAMIGRAHGLVACVPISYWPNLPGRACRQFPLPPPPPTSQVRQLDDKLVCCKYQNICAYHLYFKGNVLWSRPFAIHQHVQVLNSRKALMYFVGIYSQKYFCKLYLWFVNVYKCSLRSVFMNTIAILFVTLYFRFVDYLSFSLFSIYFWR